MNIGKFTQYLYKRPLSGAEWYFSDEHEDLDLQKNRLVQLAANNDTWSSRASIK
jgi:hypothetical protein